MYDFYTFEALIKLARKVAIIEFWSPSGSTLFNLNYECRRIELIGIEDGSLNHFGYNVWVADGLETNATCEERDYHEAFEWVSEGWDLLCGSSFKG